jgi:hypothetical protein
LKNFVLKELAIGLVLGQVEISNMNWYYTFVKNSDIGGNFIDCFGEPADVKYSYDLTISAKDIGCWIFDNYDKAREFLKKDYSIIRFCVFEENIIFILEHLYAGARGDNFINKKIIVGVSDIFITSGGK